MNKKFLSHLNTLRGNGILIVSRGGIMNLWDERFQHKRYAFGKEPNVFLTEAQNNHHIIEQNDIALAIAEGEGRNAVYLAGLGANVTAWDYSIEGLRKAERLAFERGVHVETEHVDLNEAQWPINHWDQIVCIYGHFSPPLKSKTIAHVKKALKPGGHFISEVYSIYQLPYNSGGPKSEDMLYDPIQLLEAFHDWKIKHFYTGETIRNEGDYHHGLAHVIQMFVQKPF